MTSVLLVDWLPRGGIPQTTAAWRDVARAAGHEVVVVGRAGDELAPEVAVQRRVPTKLGAAEAHLRLVRRACHEIRERQPAVVYVQHTWAPLLERRVLDTARAFGARSILAVHNAHPHQRGAGLRTGLGGLLDRADEIVVHSEHVAHQLGRPRVQLVGLPELVTITRSEPQPVPGLEPAGGGGAAPRRVVAFGVLRRGYKGLSELPDLAAALGPGWEVVAAGVGAGEVTGAVRTHGGYLAPGALHWLVSTADAVVLPYREASQSAAVLLAQALGAPPVATAVGGIPEQIDDGATGVLVPQGASAGAWADAVRRSTDIDRGAMRSEARRRQDEAADRWLELLEATATGPGAPPRGRRSGSGSPGR